MSCSRCVVNDGVGSRPTNATSRVRRRVNAASNTLRSKFFVDEKLKGCTVRAFMRFFAITLDPESIGLCRALWGDGSLYQSDELDAALDFWRVQLASNRARGAVLVDERQRPR